GRPRTTRVPGRRRCSRHPLRRYWANLLSACAPCWAWRQPSASRPMNASNLPCPLWRRLAALIYDLLIVVAIVMVVGLLCQLATGGGLIETGAHTVVPLWYQWLQGVVVAAYFVASWRLGVSRDDGGTISLQQAVVRVLVAAAPMLLLALEPLLGLHATLWTVLGA